MNDLTGDVTCSSLLGPGRMVSGDVFLPLGTDPGFMGPEGYTIWGTVFKKKSIWLHVQSKGQRSKKDWH